jgi:hypothetical protein
MSFRTPRSVAARRGTILFFIVILLLIAGTSVLFLTDAVNHNIRNTQRTEDRLKAFYVAESGVQHVVDWFNRPALSPQQSYFAPKNPAGQVDLLEGSYLDANGDSIIKSTYTVAANTLPVRSTPSAAACSTARSPRLVISPPLISDPQGDRLPRQEHRPDPQRGEDHRRSLAVYQQRPRHHVPRRHHLQGGSHQRRLVRRPLGRGLGQGQP